MRQFTSSSESVVVTSGSVEAVEGEVRTFADVEGGEPDPLLEEIALDAAIL